MSIEKTVIIGAGPAGLGAGWRLLEKGIHPVIIEQDVQVGGISKTVEYKGYRFDIGGHRFFTESPEILQLWQSIMGDNFLKKKRISRIFFKGKFFDYPLTLFSTLASVGPLEGIQIMASYVLARFLPLSTNQTFEEYIVKKFGRRLYEMFFKEYTEKLWGIGCHEISADWARERIKGLSATSAVRQAFGRRSSSIRTLIKEFYYPLLGPGMLYEEMAQIMQKKGMQLELKQSLKSVHHANGKVIKVGYQSFSGVQSEVYVSGLISTMPITELINSLKPQAPEYVREAACSLTYRNVIVVNVICAQSKIFPDNWIYVNSSGIRLCRIQNYKNWSSALVADSNTTSLGLEYFCSSSDELWNCSDEQLASIARQDLSKLGFDVTIQDYMVSRVPFAYPVYSLNYKQALGVIKTYLDSFKNLFVAGRVGRFQYDNMDMALISGMQAANSLSESNP